MSSNASSAAAPLAGKTCLVTGATSGIGTVTARALAEQGAQVLVVGRDRQRGEAVVAEIRQRTGNQAVALLLADLSAQAEVRALAAQVLERYDQLHVLVNNAGAVFSRRSETVEGIERTFALNHLAYFLLTNLLLDRLKASGSADDPARIVNVASEAARAGTIRFDDLQRRQRYHGFPAYCQSKLANIMFTYELADRLRGAPVTANCLHPGSIASGFGRNNSDLFSWFLRLTAPLMKTPEQGAQTSIYLASSPEVRGVSGQYFNNCRPIRSSRASYDNDARRRLWQISAELTGLDV